MKFSIAAVLTALVAPVAAEIYLKEDFNDDGWSKRWTVPSKWKGKSEMGDWKHTAGEWYGSEEDKGIQTSKDARFYGISAPMAKTFTSDGNTLVIQYTVKHEQDLDCGGAYIKLLPGGDKFDADNFGGDTPYAVMFGPDVCGSSNKKTHVILHYEPKEDNVLIKKEVPTETDDLTHLYTFILKSDNTFEVRVDNKSVREGKLQDEFDLLPPEEIKDPDAKKPDDWVDEAKIADPADVKPEGYDDIAEEIPDPDATKPDDWDDEDDGEWEPPMIDNPDYKGPWKPNMIDNPDYKGKWVHPKIPNPDYKHDDDMYKVCKDGCTHVGFELWQVKTGTLFDDIIVTDSIEEAEEYAKETFFKKKDAEKEMYDAAQEAKRAAEGGDDDEDEEDFGMGDEF
ncbi:Calreticulin [Seminavis robusta]|uniref:Calreticulin n=1 Tax=Seminavis robusta TaxID=568900 RepID=A0A9N8HDC2_9STRA|nr:Calreticulin [Seminavis robusta]|eukprot:Sro253_g099910.1 Calreticulin (395) ;mRNA; f:46924-48390